MPRQSQSSAVLFISTALALAATTVSNGQSDGAVVLHCYAANSSHVDGSNLCPQYFRFFQPPKGCCGRLNREYRSSNPLYLGQISVSTFEASLIDAERKEAVKVEQLDLNRRLTQILRNITNSIRRFSKIHGSTKKKVKLPEDRPVTPTTTAEPEKTSPPNEIPKHRPKPSEGPENGSSGSRQGSGQPPSTSTAAPLPRKVTPQEPRVTHSLGGGGDRPGSRTTSSTFIPDDVNTLVVDPNGRAILPGKTKIIYCTIARFHKGQPVCPKDHPYDLKRALCCGPTPIKSSGASDLVEPRPTTARPKPLKLPDFKLPSTKRKGPIRATLADCVDLIPAGKAESDCPKNKGSTRGCKR